MVLKGGERPVFAENLGPIAAEKVFGHKNAALRPLGVDLHKPDQLPAAPSVQHVPQTESVAALAA